MESSIGDYEEFFLGDVRVLMSERTSFKVGGDHVTPPAWIARGQVHLNSELDPDSETGASGLLTVNRWFALNRGLKEAPPKPILNSKPSRSADP